MPDPDAPTQMLHSDGHLLPSFRWLKAMCRHAQGQHKMQHTVTCSNHQQNVLAYTYLGHSMLQQAFVAAAAAALGGAAAAAATAVLSALRLNIGHGPLVLPVKSSAGLTEHGRCGHLWLHRTREQQIDRL